MLKFFSSHAGTIFLLTVAYAVLSPVLLFVFLGDALVSAGVITAGTLWLGFVAWSLTAPLVIVLALVSLGTFVIKGMRRAAAGSTPDDGDYANPPLRRPLFPRR